MELAAPPAHTFRPPVARAPGSLWVALPALLVLACWAGWWIPLNNDVSWQYWIARQLRGGASLYRGIVEVNPPLWFWEAVPISALADLLRVDASHVVVAAVMLRATLALGLMASLLKGEPGQRVLLLAGLAPLLCLLPLHDFAEREHLMLIGALPYTALLAYRRGARPVSARLAAGVGLYAGYGFALKPHFALIPLALELWLALAQRRSWRPLRPELLMLSVVATLYAVSILLFAPDYLRLAVPMARLAYGAFSPPFSSLLLNLWMPTWLLATFALLNARRGLPIDAQAAIVTALALGVIYFAQGKGFAYHALPVTAMLGWAIWCVLVRGAGVASAIRHPLLVVTLALMIATGFVLGPFSPVRAGRATAALEQLSPGSTVAIISAHSWLAFPLVETHRFVWPMRTMGLWTTPKIARDGEGATASPEGLLVRRRTLDMIAADLWCHPPDAILFDDPSRSPALQGTHFSYEAFTRSDARIRDLLARYRPSISDGGATVYLKQAPSVPPRGATCRAIAIRPDFR